MEKDTPSDLIYFLWIDEHYKNDLAHIRHWNNLKVAFDDNGIWLKDFDYVQINSVEVKSIPFKHIFYAKNGKLFPLNSLLPNRNIPSLLWTPISRALPVVLPSFNHNYFGITETVTLSLVPSNEEIEAKILITTMADLDKYIQNAPSIRLKNLFWAVLNTDQAFILGQPMLPILGEAYWQKEDFVIPVGYNFDNPILTKVLNNNINPQKEALIIWDSSNCYFLINKCDLRPLSLSSFRLTKQIIEMA